MKALLHPVLMIWLAAAAAPAMAAPGPSPTPMARPVGTPTPTYQDYTPAAPQLPIPRMPAEAPKERRPVPGAPGTAPQSMPGAMPVPGAPYLAPAPPERPRPTAKPKPKPKPKPAWRPPRGAVYVDRSGIYPTAVRLRYGAPLRFLQAPGRKTALSLIAVDPHVHGTGRLRPLNQFPATLTPGTAWATLGDQHDVIHRHWAIAQGATLSVQPEALLFLHDDIYGAGVGYLWPIRYLFYVAADGKWRKVVVTLTR